MEINKIYNMDCILGMQQIETGTVDMILCDLPYGITDCRWDSIIPFNLLWEQYERVIKPNGAIVLTAAQPFTTKLIHSNIKMFKYCWYWVKNQSTGFPFSKFQPLRCVEDFCVFYNKAPTYNPQGLIKLDKPITRIKSVMNDQVYRNGTLGNEYTQLYSNFPRQVLNIKCEHGLHPTQKPVALFEYLIKTYTNDGELVVDNCIGSGTTAEACIKTKRNFIGFEILETHYNTAINRIENL